MLFFLNYLGIMKVEVSSLDLCCFRMLNCGLLLGTSVSHQSCPISHVTCTVGQLHKFFNTVKGKLKTWSILLYKSNFYRSNDISYFLGLQPVLFLPEFEAVIFNSFPLTDTGGYL